MNSFDRTHRSRLRRIFLAALLSGTTLAPFAASAQQAAIAAPPASNVIADRSAWLYKGSDIPPDPQWQFGTLKNGLRYAVRRTGVPPGQVSIRVRIDAGSMAEDDSERGYAHFLEHLLYRGSKYVKDGEAMRAWQRLGATFGADTNAQTSPTQTVYQIDIPSATAAGIDDSMRMLSGMVREPELAENAIKTELPVVLAEQRESDGPQYRKAIANRDLMFAGQRLVDRTPIGTPQTLAAATPASLRAFHARWYRPNTVTVIVAGDADPELFAQTIAKYFGDWRSTAPERPMPDFGDPVATKPVARAIVEPTQPVTLSLGVIRPWRQVTDSIAYTQGLYMNLLADQLITRRLENRARAGASYLLANVSDEKVSRSAHITSVTIIPVANEWEKALRDVRAVIADAMATPPSQADIDREFASIDAVLTRSVENQQNEAAAKQVNDMVSALDIRETVTDPTHQRDVFRSVKPLATPAELLRVTRALFSGTAARAFLSIKVPNAGAEAKLAAILRETPKADRGSRLSDRPVGFDDLPRLGAPGTVRAADKVPVFDMERAGFSNGVTALVQNTPIEPDKVRVNVRFGRGRRGVDPAKPNYLWTGDTILPSGGIGKLSLSDLDRLTNGLPVGLNFDVNDDAFEFSGETTPKELRHQLQLIAAAMTAPAFQPAPVARLKTGELLAEAAQYGSPAEFLQRNLEGLLHGGDARWRRPTAAQIDTVTPEKLRAFWMPLLQSGPIEVQLFGDMRTVDARAIIAETIGALPARSVAPEVATRSAAVATGGTPQTFRHRGDLNQAAAVIAWPTGGGLAGVSTGRQLDVLAAIFNDRLFDRLRQEAGASYAPRVMNDWPQNLDNGGALVGVSLLAPKDTTRFFEIARSIAGDLGNRPITDDEVARAVGPLKEQVMRASSGNVFWMMQLEGATLDARKFEVLRSYIRDLSTVTPLQLQTLARTYLQPSNALMIQVLPSASHGTRP